MNPDILINALRTMTETLDQFDVTLEVNDPDSALSDTLAALRDMSESVSADLARLESGAFDE